MPVRVAAIVVAERSASRPYASDTSPRLLPGIVASGLVGLGRTTRDPRYRADAHSPGLGASDRRPGEIVLRLGVLARDRPWPFRSNRRRRALRTNLAAPARASLSAGDATRVCVAKPTGAVGRLS
jgi:hypothetical protein